MEEQYNPNTIEPKWQGYWEQQDLFRAKDFASNPKIFLLVEFPYPSGAGLHVGHCRSYTAMDVIARKKRMQGYNVLFPMGWDAFGLPTENYALKTGIHPTLTTKQSIATFKKQEKSLGFSFDWAREINTTDPSYYKWTQWIFLKLFENGLAYKTKMPINWCLSCKIGLANEEVVDGKCERCGGPVEKREKEQWLIKITEYAERLIKDLDLVDFPEKVKIQQKEWIGKSEGWEIKFRIQVLKSKAKNATSKVDLRVFTTRIDTIFGCTYLVVAPEHQIISNLKSHIVNLKEVQDYIAKARRKSELERQAETKEKTGVQLKGVIALNPVNGKEIPIFVADYVLATYGTGAIMAVPAHDERDYEFAKKYNLPYVQVILPPNIQLCAPSSGEKLSGAQAELAIKTNCYSGEGVLINSGQFDGLSSKQAKEKIGQWLAKQGLAQKAVNYKLRDWVFSRQRYWGEPIPLVFCAECYKTITENSKLQLKNSQQNTKRKTQNAKKEFSKGEILNPGWIALQEKDLPVVLPDIQDYKPTDKGDSPLAKIKEWVSVRCPKCHSIARRETDVMPNWAGSNWYFLRYCDPCNKQKFADAKLLKYWMPVDWYNGGMEHVTLHLLYSRFIYKFLWDIGEVPRVLGPEPYKKRTSQGMILAQGGVKMSKSKGNVVNPDDVVKEYGADTLRVYEMFMGPFDQAIAWDTKGVRGVSKFLRRIFHLQSQILHSQSQTNTQSKIVNLKIEKLLHKTIKKVSEDIDNMKFNTAISSLMILLNEMEKEEQIPREIFEKFLLVLSPFAPHLAEELWHRVGNQDSIFLQQWPDYDKKLLQETTIKIIAQINGKVRGTIEAQQGASEQEILQMARQDSKINKWLEGKKIKRVIFIKDKLINFVL